MAHLKKKQLINPSRKLARLALKTGRISPIEQNQLERLIAQPSASSNMLFEDWEKELLSVASSQFEEFKLKNGFGDSAGILQDMFFCICWNQVFYMRQFWKGKGLEHFLPDEFNTLVSTQVHLLQGIMDEFQGNPLDHMFALVEAMADPRKLVRMRKLVERLQSKIDELLISSAKFRAGRRPKHPYVSILNRVLSGESNLRRSCDMEFAKSNDRDKRADQAEAAIRAWFNRHDPALSTTNSEHLEMAIEHFQKKKKIDKPS